MPVREWQEIQEVPRRIGFPAWGREMPARRALGRPQQEAAASSTSRTLSILICLLLALATLVIYAQTATHGYVAYDDDQYVYQNPWVKSGLTASNVAWAFRTFFYANWHPLTWISTRRTSPCLA